MASKDNLTDSKCDVFISSMFDMAERYKKIQVQ